MPLDLRRRHQELLGQRMLIPPLKMQFLELGREKFLEQRKSSGLVGEEKQVGLGITCYLDGAIVNAVVKPVRRDFELSCQLGYGQEARDITGMGLAPLQEQAMA